MENQTKITALLGIKYPILQGPMGGGFSTPELLAAVSNAGAWVVSGLIHLRLSSSWLRIRTSSL